MPPKTSSIALYCTEACFLTKVNSGSALTTFYEFRKYQEWTLVAAKKGVKPATAYSVWALFWWLPGIAACGVASKLYKQSWMLCFSKLGVVSLCWGFMHYNDVWLHVHRFIRWWPRSALGRLTTKRKKPCINRLANGPWLAPLGAQEDYSKTCIIEMCA